MLNKRHSRRAGPQYLHDLAAGCWYAEVLGTAVELEVFTLLDPRGKTAGEIAGARGCSPEGLERLLQALCALGLTERVGEVYVNTKISEDFLVKGKKDYQGEVVLWRKHLNSYWQGLGECLKAGGRVAYPSGEDQDQMARRVRQYLRAMDGVARVKIQEILPLFEGISPAGEILDVGGGSGAISAGFLERFPSLRATLLDLPGVLDHAEELIRERGLGERVTCRQANILEPWPVPGGCFDLVILSNIIHVYSDAEVPGILAGAAECLTGQGYLIIHDFFLEHFPEQATLYDLNMFINTYNGRVFSCRWVRQNLERLKLHVTGLIPLKSDTAMIVASKSKNSLSRL